MAANLKQNSDGSAAFAGTGAQILNIHPSNKVLSAVVGTIARTDTVAKTLGVIPKNGVPVAVMWSGPANSDAGTTATISAGYTAGTEFINAANVKAGSTSQNLPASGANLGAAISTTADTNVTGVYAETGTASTTGGPWTVIVWYYMNA